MSTATLRRIVLFCLGIVSIAALLDAYRSGAAEEASLARVAPPGAVLYLEARNFSGLLEEWNRSQEKGEWVRSANHEVFSKSRLFLRLKEASDQFAVAAGLPPDMNFVAQLAGEQSGLALYDIGKLQFLYVTRIEAGKAEQSALFLQRSKLETRSAGGVTFYYSKNAEHEREVAFAMSGGYLLLATREDLMAGALERLVGSKEPSLESEAWWTSALQGVGRAGDLRLVLNLEKIVPSPYFRSYWIQKNITDMKAYRASVSDLYLSPREYREERVLVRMDEHAGDRSADAGSAAAGQLAQWIPADAGSYQVVASPSADACLDLLESKLLAPHTGPEAASQFAPQVQLTSGVTGGAGALDTRIDHPPAEVRPETAASAALQALLAQNPVQAALTVESTDFEKDGVFVRIHTAVVLAGSAEWNEAAVESALAEYVRPMLSASGLGTAWQKKAGYAELDGLSPLAASVRGKVLIVSDDPRLLGEIASNAKQTAKAEPAVLIAGFNHASERSRYLRLTAALDKQAGKGEAVPDRTPSFFSENLGSLSTVLSRVSSERIVVHDSGARVRQTVIYAWTE